MRDTRPAKNRAEFCSEEFYTPSQVGPSAPFQSWPYAKSTPAFAGCKELVRLSSPHLCIHSRFARLGTCSRVISASDKE